MSKKISIIWKNDKMRGFVSLSNDGSITICKNGSVGDYHFSLLEEGEKRLELDINGAKTDPGAFGTIVHVRTEKKPFSFFLRDIKSSSPVYIPDYEVIVTEADDQRSYNEIEQQIIASERVSALKKYTHEREESFDNAAGKTKKMRCPTWLGLSRDIRMFEVSPYGVVQDSDYWNTITPMYHHTRLKYPEMGDELIKYNYFTGRGVGCQYNLTRWLEQKILPILNIVNIDGGIRYEQKLFVTNEMTPLIIENLKGTHFLVSDMYAAYPTKRTSEQQMETEQIHDSEIFRHEETVLYLRIEALNVSSTPRYAFVRVPQPNVSFMPEMDNHPIKFMNGYASFLNSGRVFMTCTLNGNPFSEIDSSVLIQPGEKAVYICKIPHLPIPVERAKQLIDTDFEQKLTECIEFWQGKLKKIATIHLPESRIEDMMKAGFLHLDLVCFGNEPDDAVAPVVGVYTPIGTESTPIIQYIESLGDSKLAERAIMYFIKKQRPDGFIQNFQTYMSETGCALWNAAEHVKYTNNLLWLNSIKSNLIRGCDYIIRWAEESYDNNLKKKGYGMIYGKVADRENSCRAYMLNAMAYGGLRSVADVLRAIDPYEADRIGNFAEEMKINILESLSESFAIAPVVPLSDGTWCPSVSPWPEQNMFGMGSLFTTGGSCFSHGMMVGLDGGLGGGHYLVTNGVLQPDSIFIKFISNIFTDLLSIDNVGFSQPYYCQHPYTHIKLGQVGAFLSEFYNGVSALADRETYTFWEHLFQISPHKTHEEGWFLMRCRWMLYIDDYNDLFILGGIPRAWLENGKIISFTGMNTRYGQLSVYIESQIEKNKIFGRIELKSNHYAKPQNVIIRIPHPNNITAVSAHGGQYNSARESLFLICFDEYAEFELSY